MAPLPILYRDDALVVVSKPSGLLVHRSAIDRQAAEFALQTVRDQIGRTVYPVHRLDRATSGALIFALSPSAARFLSGEFASGNVNKVYVTVVRGFAPEEIVVDHPLKEELDAKADHRVRPDKVAQPAVTRFVRLATCEVPVAVDKFPTSRYSLVRAFPRTGRKHQIRRHLRHIGCPIIGDVNYGCGRHNRFFRSEYSCRRLLLAATEVSFRHPAGGDPVRVKAPLAEDFRRVAQALGWGQCFGE